MTETKLKKIEKQVLDYNYWGSAEKVFAGVLALVEEVKKYRADSTRLARLGRMVQAAWVDAVENVDHGPCTYVIDYDAHNHAVVIRGTDDGASTIGDAIDKDVPRLVAER